MRKYQRNTNRRHSFQSLEPRHLLAADPLVTEVMASNTRTLDDGNGLSSDWIEIYNAGDVAADLTGWHLTDDINDPMKWSFPSVQVQPDSFLVVFASGEGEPDHLGYFHTNFRLSSAGETVALVRPEGTVKQQLVFAQQHEDVSYGLRTSDLSTSGFFANPTPGAANDVVLESVTTATVSASRASGTFTGEVALTLAASQPGATIAYTLDGSLPNNDSTRYTGPITLVSTTQVRARVIQPNRVAGPVTTSSYLRLAADVVDFAAQLPIMVMENFNRGDIPNTGWNQTNAGIQQLPRQAASIMLFDPSDGISRLGESADLSSRIGIRVRGAFSSSFDEPGLSVETWANGADVDRDVALAGIAADSDWVLYAPHPDHDHTLMDNTFVFDLSKQMGHWAPDVRYVETFVNSDGGDITMADHVGLYVITEKVKRADDRLAFDRLSADGTSGGWLLEINRMDSIALDGTTPRNFHTAGPDGILETELDLFDASSVGDDIPRQYNAYINFDDPNGFSINPAQRASIEGWIRQMEDVLYGRVEGVDWTDPVHGYAKYIDVDNFIDYFILNDISHNGDALLLSLWLYNTDPSGDGKLKFGPIWDVDLGSFTENPQIGLMRRTNELWYGRLFDDPNFVVRFADRWEHWRQTVLSAPQMHATVDRIFDAIGNESAIRDGVNDLPDRLQRMKDWLTVRGNAIDELFVRPANFNRTGGVVPAGFELSGFAFAGDAYYTTDGSDPRQSDGTISPVAIKLEREFETLLTAPSLSSAIVPDEMIDNQIGASWIDPDFVEGAAGETWIAGQTGVGYDRRGSYAPLIETDLGDSIQQVYARVPFELTRETLDDLGGLILRMQYDDGFVAFLNGHEIARSNAPGQFGEPLVYDQRASTSHRARDGRFDEYTLSDLSILRPGTNVLAIQGLNLTATGSDLLIRPELVGVRVASPPLVIDESVSVTSRVFADDQWSGIRITEFVVAHLPGDANADGQFDQIDIDQVLRSGKYLSGEPATFAEGDWNDDGLFDQTDIVEALKTGNYSPG